MCTTRLYFVIRLCAVLIAGLCPAATVRYEIFDLQSDLGSPSRYRYAYSIVDVTFHPRQELDILFDPVLFCNLSDGRAGAGFDVMLFQPNNPPGSPGHYTAMALVDNPTLDAFRVDFTFLGPGVPGSQPFLINQFDENGQLVEIIDSGVSTVPEPGNFLIVVPILAGMWRAVLRRRARTA
jgi:hypothetical protein